MAGDDKKSTAKAAPKEKTPPKDKAPADAPANAEAKTAVAAPKAEAAAPSNYSRGEGQKPVSQAYKDNWNAIFAKKNVKKNAKKKKY